MFLYLVVHRVHFLFFELTFVEVLEISFEGVVLPLGLGVLCFPLLDGGSRGLSFRTYVFWGPTSGSAITSSQGSLIWCLLGVSPILGDLRDVTRGGPFRSG